MIAEASERGMRYVSLPMSLTTVDQDHVARFHFEISLADARPIYFFDTEGNRPGMLWYIHRMTDRNEGYDLQEAAREAEEIGLTADAFRKAAEKYVDTAKAHSTPMTPVETAVSTNTSTSRPVTSATPQPATPVEPAPEPDPALVSSPGSGIPAKPEALAVPLASSPDLAAASTPPAARTPTAPAAAGVLRDPNAWRPFLALLLTALGVPCAYWSRSVISFRGLKRASLPGPGRRLRSLPAASGE
jgi:hypothetical protein